MGTTFWGGDDEARRKQEVALRRRERPDNEVPRSLAFDAVLAGNDEVAVVISGVRVFSNGVEFTVEAHARRVSTDPRYAMVGDLYGHGESDDRLFVGIEFADGRRCTSLDHSRAHNPGETSERPQITLYGGGSTGSRGSLTKLFLSPLPPPGDLRLVCAWPTRGLPEEITVVSADDVLEAARHVRELWPWEPEPEMEWRPTPPVLPEGGWFAAAEADAQER